MAKTSTIKMPGRSGGAKKKQAVKTAKPKKTRHKSASGSAAKPSIAGRHPPGSGRYKTGWWRPVRQHWMSDEVWEAYKAIHRMANKSMGKGLRRASLGKDFFGKEGPGHAGFGTGRLQKMADRVLKQGKDPHVLDMLELFGKAAAAIDYHTGERNFRQLEKEQRGDSAHFMHRVVEMLKKSIPEVRKMSKTAVKDLMEHRYYTAQYGPDGRAK